MRKQILAAAIAVSCTGMAAAALADTAESTTVGGRLFIDFTNIKQETDGLKQPTSGTGLDVKRGYIIINHTFDDTWSANLTTDFNYVSGDVSSETQVFIKKAYVQGKLSDAFFARAGSADMPWIPYVEDLYGYRYVEKVMIDRIGYGTSADWGLHAGGKVANNVFNYAVSVVNGNGYKNPTRTDAVDVEARIGFTPIPGLAIAVGGYDGKLGQDVYGTNGTKVDTRSAQRYDAVAGYSMPDVFRVGVEYFHAKDWKGNGSVGNAVLESNPTDTSDGYSGWASVSFAKQFSIFARYDQVKPAKDTHDNLKDTYYNAGFAYKPRKNIDLALAYKHEKVENGAFKTGDATLGRAATSTVAASKDGTWKEFGIWAQVGF